jgi:hypothetical protein
MQNRCKLPYRRDILEHQKMLPLDIEIMGVPHELAEGRDVLALAEPLALLASKQIGLRHSCSLTEESCLFLRGRRLGVRQQ